MPATFIFYLREDRPDKRGLCPVMLKITQDRKRKYLSSGIRLDPKDWNHDKQLVRRSHPNYNKLNQELDIIRETASQAYRELNRDNRASAESIKKRIEYSSKDNFFTLAKEYLDSIKKDQYYTWKQSRVAVNKIKDFHGSDDLPVNLIGLDFLNDLMDYMQRKLKNKSSTVRKNMGAISNILDIAVRQYLIPENPMGLNEFSLPKQNGKIKKAKIPYKKIKQIEALNLEEGSNLWHSRNTFILAFYFCGIRFGDLAMLTWGNVRNGRMRYTMGKTGQEIDIKIPEGANYYLELYSEDENKDDEYILPFLKDLSDEERKDSAYIRKRVNMWNVFVNGQEKKKKATGLKKIANMVDINEVLSMHVARHSFAQYVVEEKNIPVYRLMVLLGHQNIRTTMEYLKTISVKAADETMDEIF